MSKQNPLEAEVAKATGLTRDAKEDGQTWLARLARGCAGLKDDKWDALSEGAQAWMNDAIQAVKDKKAVPTPPGSEDEPSEEAAEDKDAPDEDAADDDEDSDDDEEATKAAKADAADEDSDDEDDDEPAADEDSDDDEDEPAASEDDEDSDDEDEPASKEEDDDEDEAPAEKPAKAKKGRVALDADEDDDEEAPASKKASKKEKPAKAAKPERKSKAAGREGPKKGPKAERGSGEKFRRLVLRHPDYNREKAFEVAKEKGLDLSWRSAFVIHYAVHSTLRTLHRLDMYHHGGKSAWEEEAKPAKKPTK